MGAVAVVKRAHDLQVRLAAFWARLFVYDEVTGVALVFALLFRNIVRSLIFLSQHSLFCTPIHTISSQKCLINI